MSGPGYGAGPANQGFYPSGGAHMMGSGMQMAAGGAQMAGRAVRGAGKGGRFSNPPEADAAYSGRR